MSRILALLLLGLAAAAPAPARAEAEGGVDADVGLADAVAEKLAENPELRRAEADAKERTERRKRQQRDQEPGSESEEPLPEGAMEKMLREVPAGPAQLDDLRAEAAEERAKLAMESIEAATLAKAAPDARDLYRNYLIEVFFRGNAGTDVGQLIQRGLTTPEGWRVFPTMAHGPVPPGAAATWGGGHITIGPGGDSLVVVSHEWYHHTGHPDDGPDSAYVWMGREFGGGGLGGQEAGGPEAESTEASSGAFALRCAL